MLDAEDFHDILMRTCRVRALGFVGLGVCGTNPVVVLALNASNLRVVAVVSMAIVSVDGSGGTY